MFNPFKKKPFAIDDFAKLVMTEAKKAGIVESLEYDPKRSVIIRGNQRTYLVNLFNDYCQADAGLFLDSHGANLSSAPWKIVSPFRTAAATQTNPRHARKPL